MKDEDKTKKQFLSKFVGIHKADNSDVIKHTLISLINVASTKTSEDYAWSSIKNLLRELEENYDFLKYVRMKNLKNLDNFIDGMAVMSDMDNVEPREVGMAIQSLVDLFKRHLGKRAGYFFIREFRDDLGDDYHLIIKNMGVDLRLAELQEELGEWDSEEYKIKDDSDVNIAFVEKK